MTNDRVVVGPGRSSAIRQRGIGAPGTRAVTRAGRRLRTPSVLSAPCPDRRFRRRPCRERARPPEARLHGPAPPGSAGRLRKAGADGAEDRATCRFPPIAAETGRQCSRPSLRFRGRWHRHVASLACMVSRSSVRNGRTANCTGRGGSGGEIGCLPVRVYRLSGSTPTKCRSPQTLSILLVGGQYLLSGSHPGGNAARLAG